MRPLRILLVEDHAIIALLLGDMLVALGHEICATEATCAGAIRAASLHDPELMIVDGRLADGSGVAAVAEILRAGARPHLFISGARLEGHPADAVVLQKPFLEPDLIWAMQRALAAGGAPDGTAAARQRPPAQKRPPG